MSAAEKHNHVAEGRTVDQFLRQAAELVSSRAAGDLVHVVERLACCCSDREKSLVCLVYYRGLDNAGAADVLGITEHQAKDALRSAVKRYQALTITRRREIALVNGDRVATRKPGSGGEEMTLAELEAMDSGQTAAGSVQERTAACRPMGMVECGGGRATMRATGIGDGMKMADRKGIREGKLSHASKAL